MRPVVSTVIMRARAPGYDYFQNHFVPVFSHPRAFTPMGALSPIAVQKSDEISSILLFDPTSV